MKPPTRERERAQVPCPTARSRRPPPRPFIHRACPLADAPPPHQDAAPPLATAPIIDEIQHNPVNIRRPDEEDAPPKVRMELRSPPCPRPSASASAPLPPPPCGCRGAPNSQQTGFESPPAIVVGWVLGEYKKEGSPPCSESKGAGSWARGDCPPFHGGGGQLPITPRRDGRLRAFSGNAEEEGTAQMRSRPEFLHAFRRQLCPGSSYPPSNGEINESS